eukprot:6352833-Prymnesium_polylepis.1
MLHTTLWEPVLPPRSKAAADKQQLARLQKPYIIAHALRCGVDVMFSDLDVGFLTNPLAYWPSDGIDVR